MDGRRASYGLLPSISTFSIEPEEERSKSARASFSRSPATSTLALDQELAPQTTSMAQINEALKSIDWTPCLGGSSYSINRSPLSPMAKSPISRSPANRSPVSKSSRTTPVHAPEPDIVINVEDTDIWDSFAGNANVIDKMFQNHHLFWEIVENLH